MSIKRIPYDKEEEENVKRDIEALCFGFAKREEWKERNRINSYLYDEEYEDELDEFIEEGFV